MKRILLLIIASPFFCNAQKPFAKLSPTLFILTDKDMGMLTTPAVKDQTIGGFVAGGLIVHRWIAAGLTAGYFKPVDFKASGISFDKPVIPVGLDFTFTDFDKKKIKPVIQVQAMYPIHSQPSVTYTDQGGFDNGTSKFKGIIMVGISGGIAVPVWDNKKILFTGGYSSLTLKNNYPKKSTSTGMVTISASFFYK
jgi:hypothetical protein